MRMVPLTLTRLAHAVRGAVARAAARAAVATVAISLSAVAAPMVVGGTAHAQHPFEDRGSAFMPDDGPRAFMAQRGRLSLAQASAMAQSRYQGRIVRAETVEQGGRVIHVIRILGDDGRVRTVRIDAETGAMM